MVLKGNALLLPLHWHCGSQSLIILRKNFSLSQTGKTNNQGSYVVSSSSWLVYFKLNHELWIHRNLERGRNNDIILIYYYLNWLHVKLLSVRCPMLRMCGHWRVELQTIHRFSTIIEKASTRAFTWLKEPTSAFTFKTLLRHYAKQNRCLNMVTVSRLEIGTPTQLS